MGRTDFARRVGILFNNKRDTYATLGYDKALSILHYRDRYERGGIAERIIDSYPFATWSGGARVVESPNPDTETAFERATRLLFDQLDVWDKFQRAHVLASLGHYSVIYIGAQGDPTTDLTTLPGPLKIAYLKPLAESDAWIESWIDGDDQRTNPRYGLPAYYNLTVRTSYGAARIVKVHWTRVIHVAEGTLDSDLFGRPRLRACWNYLVDLDKVVGAGAEAAWKRMDAGLQVDVDPTVELNEDDEARMDEELQAYEHDVSRMIRTRGTKINPLSAQAQSFGPNADSLVKLICATTGIPYRILTGSERGQLASTQDRFNWSDRINELRRGFATKLIRDFIKRLIDGKALPKPAGWDELNTPTFTPPDYLAVSVTPNDPNTATTTLNTSVAASAAAHAATPIAASSSDTVPLASIPGGTGSYPGGYTIVWPEVGETSDTDKADIANKLAAANQAQSIAGLPPILTSDDIRHEVFGLGPLPDKVKADLAKAQADKAAAAAAKAAAPFSSLHAPPAHDDNSAAPLTPSGNKTPTAPSKGAAAGT